MAPPPDDPDRDPDLAFDDAVAPPRRPRRFRRIGTLSFNRMMPNLVTLLAMCAGLTAIRYALNEQWERAVVALIIAAFLDSIDGRVARLLRSTSKFGEELDSLADAVSFGVAPAMMVYLWAMHNAGSIGWALCLLHAVCCVLRLARFNAMLGQPDLPPWAHSYFTGVPAPGGAGLAVLPMIASFEFGAGFFGHPVVVGGFLLLSSFLMVSRVPTYAAKNFRLKPQWVVPFMLFVGVMAAFMVTDPWLTWTAIGVIYLASIPVSMSTYRRLAARDADLPPPPPDIAKAR